jgi:prokaryotic ubiquitin-like protein Pup
MAAKDTSSRPQPGKRAKEAAARPGKLSDDVGAILDDMDDVLEENAEEIVRSYVQEGGQ